MILGLVIGLFVGAFVGVAAMALMQANRGGS